MIIVKLRGALGNQMFQYAFARALAIEKHQLLLIDDTSLKNYASKFTIYKRSRLYKLGYFGIRGIRCPFNPNKLASILGYFGRKFVKITKIENLDPIYDENLFRNTIKLNDIILDGHWLSEKYFSKYSTEILKDFSLNKYTKKVDQKILKEICDTNSVSLHVRRGDYVTNPKVAKEQGIVTLSYYSNALKYIQERVENLKLFVFSDDIDWVKTNLKFDFPTEYIDGNVNEPVNDLFLMSKCKHNIIANSTFSWWGAWLNRNKKKIVISPKYWFLNNIPSSNDIVPEGWIKL
ncbi:MAG: alpha-1,2-fucosyltransferase [Candidatus Dojkabacteria bacterium]